MGSNGAKSEKINLSEILKIIGQGEGELVEFKDSRILADPFKLARSMSALSNQKGGFILIGVKDDGTIEGLKFQKEHEERIMNIASEKCSPPVRPRFESVSIPEKGDVYVIQISKRENEPYHGVKTRDGLVYFTRVGSTIREIQPHELSGRKGKGVKVEPYTPSEKGFLLLTDKMVTTISNKRDWSFTKTIWVLTSIGVSFVACSLTLFFAAIYGVLGMPSTSFPTWAYIAILIWLFSGFYLMSTAGAARETKCPACRRFFKFKKIESVVLSKRTLDEDTEEWKVHNLYRCDSCGYEEEETVYEKHDRD
jgi:hypothetical protein